MENLTFRITSSRWAIFCISCYFLIVLHLVIPNNGGTQGDSLPWVITGWIFILLMITGMCAFTARGQEWCITPALTIFALAAVLLTIPIFWSPHPSWKLHALPRLFGLWGGLACYFSLLQCRFNKQDWIIIICVIGCSSFIQSIFVFLQFFHSSSLPLLSQQVTENGKIGYGVFQQKNVTASFLATGLIMLTVVTCFFRCSRCYDKLLLLMLSIADIAILTIIILLNSRIGWLDAVVTLLLLILIINIYADLNISKKRKLLLYLIISCGLTLGLVLDSVIPAELTADHIGSNHQRLLTLFYSMKLFYLSPWIGWGYGGYEFFFQHWMSMQNPSPQTLEVMNHPHNEILFWIVEGGVLPLIAIIVMLVNGLYLVLSRVEFKKSIAGVAILPILLHTQVEYPLYQSSAHWFIIILIAVYIDAGRTMQKRLMFEPVFYMKFFSGMVSFICTIFLCFALFNEVILTKFENRELISDEIIIALPFSWLSYERHTRDITLMELVLFNQDNDSQHLERFLQQTRTLLTTRIDADLYYEMIKVERFLKQREQSNDDLCHAERLFPYDHRFYCAKNNPPPQGRINVCG